MSGIATAIAVGTVATVGGSYLAAESASDAADTQAGAIGKASDISAAAAAEARQDVMGSIDPAKLELSTGITDAINRLTSGEQRQLNVLGDTSRQQLGSITGGTETGISTLRNALTSGTGALTSGIDTARSDISSGVDAGLDYLSPYAATGQQALQQEAAMTGVLGAEAQQQALDSYLESPGQAYLREQQEQALLRNASALGGLGGGNVRTALQQQAFNIASTDQQKYLENLRSLSGAGQNAATAQAGIQTGGASSLANLAAQQGMTEAQLIQQLQSSIAGQEIGLGQQQSDITGQYGTNVSNIIGAGSSNIANLLAQQGAGLSDITRGGATTLANIAVGQGSQQAQFAQDIGSAEAAGILGQASAYQQGLQGLGSGLGLAAGIYGGGLKFN